MSRPNKTDEMKRLRELQEQLETAKVEQEKNSRKAKFPELLALALTAMKSNRERTWNIKKGSADNDTMAKLNEKVKTDGEAFVKAYRRIVRNDLKRWWGAELQKAYIQGAPDALLVFYLSDNPNETKPLAYALKKAADDYVRGWELLGKKNRKELSGPLDRVGNGALAVQILIEQLKAGGDKLQEVQAKILEITFADPIAALGQKNSESDGFTLGETLG